MQIHKLEFKNKTLREFRNEVAELVGQSVRLKNGSTGEIVSVTDIERDQRFMFVTLGICDDPEETVEYFLVEVRKPIQGKIYHSWKETFFGMPEDQEDTKITVQTTEPRSIIQD